MLVSWCFKPSQPQRIISSSTLQNCWSIFVDFEITLDLTYLEVANRMVKSVIWSKARIYSYSICKSAAVDGDDIPHEKLPETWCANCLSLEQWQPQKIGKVITVQALWKTGVVVERKLPNLFTDLWTITINCQSCTLDPNIWRQRYNTVIPHGDHFAKRSN